MPYNVVKLSVVLEVLKTHLITVINGGPNGLTHFNKLSTSCHLNWSFPVITFSLV